MSKFYDFKSKVHFTKFRELDEFIQNSLDKFFFVEPWINLYENTGIFSKYIISNKSTIPDLIIFNKTFNKNDCYEGANRNYFNKFPRLRFILRPRYKEFYNPCDTIGNNEDIFIKNKNYNKEKKLSEKSNNNNYNDNIYLKNTNSNSNNKYIKPLKKYVPEGDFEDGIILSELSPDNIFETNTNSNNIKNEDNKKNNEIKNEDSSNKNDNKIKINNDNKTFNFNNPIPENKKSIPQNKTNQEQYDDEDEPEWENDDVTNYTTRIEFQEIPKDLKEKAEKEIDKRGKIDIYNNKVLQTINEENSNINNNNNNNNNHNKNNNNNNNKSNFNNDNNSNEEILKFDESKGGNIFEQLENFLKLDDKNSNEKENSNNNFFDNYNNNNNKSNSHYNNNNNLPFSSFNRNKKKNNYIYNNNMNVNNINKNLEMQNMQLRYQLQQQAQQAQLQQLYFLQQQQYLNYIQMQNIQNQMMNGIYGNIPNNNQRNPMINMNMNMNFSLNNNNQNLKNLDNNLNTNVNNEENEEEDPMMNDFTTDNKYYNPTVFLENPALIVKKNLIEKNWFLMKDGKILGNYNSEELLFLLDEKIKEGNDFNNISINDYQTDVVFQPKILYEILKEHVSKIKQKYLESKFLNQVNNSNNNSNINSMSPFNSLNGNINQLFH
jgi:hypothetical protein